MENLNPLGRRLILPICLTLRLSAIVQDSFYIFFFLEMSVGRSQLFEYIVGSSYQMVVYKLLGSSIVWRFLDKDILYP